MAGNKHISIRTLVSQPKKDKSQQAVENVFQIFYKEQETPPVNNAK